jgi:hypothetical protein
VRGALAETEAGGARVSGQRGGPHRVAAGGAADGDPDPGGDGGDMRVGLSALVRRVPSWESQAAGLGGAVGRVQRRVASSTETRC